MVLLLLGHTVLRAVAGAVSVQATAVAPAVQGRPHATRHAVVGRDNGFRRGRGSMGLRPMRRAPSMLAQATLRWSTPRLLLITLLLGRTGIDHCRLITADCLFVCVLSSHTALLGVSPKWNIIAIIILLLLILWDWVWSSDGHRNYSKGIK